MKVQKIINSNLKFYFFTAKFMVFISVQVLAQSYYSEVGTASFTSSIPYYEFTGSSNQLTGLIDVSENTVDFYLDLETLDSGIKKRDKDMRLTLETKKYPFAEFYGILLDSIDFKNTQLQSIRTKGNFSIHGVSQEIEVKGNLTMIDNALKLTAEWIVKLDDYDIIPPSFFIIKVDPIQKIYIDVLLVRQ
tara:strand:+ start:7627 stop:8196 length:570 start_codon:yes stop_codon:yes gene_type:complete